VVVAVVVPAGTVVVAVVVDVLVTFAPGWVRVVVVPGYVDVTVMNWMDPLRVVVVVPDPCAPIFAIGGMKPMANIPETATRAITTPTRM